MKDEKVFLRRAKMELIDRGFSQKKVDKQTNLPLFTINFTPIISTKRIFPHKRWLELVYAMPYLVLRREIFNSFKRTKNVLASVKQIWNIFVHLDFPLGRYEYITTRLHRVSREIMKIQDPRSKIQVKPVSDILYPVSSSFVNLVKSRGFYFAYPYAHLERETLLNGQKIFSQLKSSSMELAQPVSHETATTRIETEKESAFTNYQLPVVVTSQPTVISHKLPAVSYQKSDAVYRPYGHLERETLLNGQKIISYFNFKTSSMELAQPVSHETATTGIETEKESAFTNYQLPVVTHQLPIVSHKPSSVSYKNLATYILSSTSDFITPLFSYYFFNPAFFLRQKTGPVKQREVPLNLQKSDALYRPYGHLERETLLNGQKIFSQLKPSSMELAHPVSPENTSEVEKAPLYHTYPEIEHVTSTHTEIIKERVIEKEVDSKPPHAQSASIDVNRLGDQVYSFIERKIRIEKERRGFYG